MNPWPDIPTLTPITARPVDLNPEAWGDGDAWAAEASRRGVAIGDARHSLREREEDPDTPRCYVKGCGETENLEPCFVGEYVCPECKVSQQHQREVAGEFALEGAEG